VLHAQSEPDHCYETVSVLVKDAASMQTHFVGDVFVTDVIATSLQPDPREPRTLTTGRGSTSAPRMWGGRWRRWNWRCANP
jgi:hypothetical protein